MNKILFYFLLILVSNKVFAGSQDFIAGIDFTGRSNVTQSALNQLVNSGTVATNKGLVIWTNGSPNVTTDPKLVRFIWMDTSVNPPALKTYNTNSGVWVSSSISADSITTAMLQNSAVTTIKIANGAVDSSKLADDSVTSAKIVDGTIIAADLAPNSIINSKISPGVVSATSLGTNVIFNYHLNEHIIYPSNLAVGVTFTGLILAANSIYNSNLNAGIIFGSNIANATITSTNIASGTITTNLLATNVYTLLPRAFAVIDSAGNMLRGIGFSASVKTSTGDYTVTFSESPGYTNYCVMAMAGDFAGSHSDLGVNVSTNTTTKLSVNVWVRGTGADEDPDLLYITVIY